MRIAPVTLDPQHVLRGPRTSPTQTREGSSVLDLKFMRDAHIASRRPVLLGPVRGSGTVALSGRPMRFGVITLDPQHDFLWPRTSARQTGAGSSAVRLISI